MTDINLLKAEIVRNGYNLSTFSKAIGMPASTFSRRIKSGNFKTDESAKIIEILEIDNPVEIFFAKK